MLDCCFLLLALRFLASLLLLFLDLVGVLFVGELCGLSVEFAVAGAGAVVVFWSCRGSLPAVVVSFAN